MRSKLSVIAFLIYSFVLFVSCYNVPPTGIPAASEVDTMIRQCFQTACKEWMTECHWYCDSIKGAIKSVRYDVRNCFNNPDIRLVPIGSAVNHLLNNSSDLDLVLTRKKELQSIIS
ncbi:hypothetical protein CAEBREN_08479 [Caenorhabditis brenneri]|uniref:Uncharacterized protein n=1 Tax=Caenorhabditis brenneri TaxID=135651 RepID=G0PM60_CAEBE|nr:hypothetical protein CAEBREN_08479 [Caenorhabditis brenneri]